MLKTRSFPAILAAALLAAGALPILPAVAADQLATATASVKPSSLAPGGHGTLAITITTVPGAHVNAHVVPDPNSIPTVFAPSKTSGITLGAVRYPAGHSATISGAKESLYIGHATITVPFTVSKSAKSGVVTMGGKLTFQACNSQFCLPPKTETLNATVTVK